MKIRTRVFMTVIVVFCALAGAANGDPTYSGKFTLPYEVHWGRATLPAGNYSMTMEGLKPAAKIHSANGKNWFVLGAATENIPLKGGAFLFVTSNAGQHTVRYLNAPMLARY